ncbi:MAG: radical SAM protein [Candidatus Omnitrophica bacterium]|nr:radical SAM protein [Candidatus Omnitrophota bacterium]
MFCQVAQRKFSDLAFSIDNAAIERRMPYMCALELTYRCNLSCKHCYCNLEVSDRRRFGEMTTEEVLHLLDEIAGAGCFWLLLTGGEVLVRKDFWQIYLHAVKRGMLVNVFTNATLLDDDLAGRFAEYPPLSIDISLYGSTPMLHDSITAVPGSFKKTMEAIERLRRRKVKFSLKTILMTLNHIDLENMRSLSKSMDAEFRYDTMIAPRSDGGMSAAGYRLSADVMADLDLDEDWQACERIFDGFWGKIPESPLACGAGIFAFNINPYGILSPCTMFGSFQYPLGGTAFADAWKKLVNDYGKKSCGLAARECRACSMQLICANCPAWAELEAKALDKKVDYICEYAKTLEKKYFAKKEGNRNGKEALSETAD